jgi:hypothetical protein
MKNSTYSRRSQMVSTVKKVARDDPGGLLMQERPPRSGRAPWRGAKSVAVQRRTDRGCRHSNAEVPQFSLDALVAPARVLGGQADDQLLCMFVQRWSPASTMWVGPRAGDQASMPAQQRVGLDEEAGPAGSWQQSADRGEYGAVGGF